MSILSALVQASQYNEQNRQKGMQDIMGLLDEQKARKIGQKFIQANDFTPQGLQKFAQENSLSVDEMKGLVDMAVKYRQYQKEMLPKTADYETQGADGVVRSQTVNMEAPPNDPARVLVDMVKSRPKPEMTTTQNPQGDTAHATVNPWKGVLSTVTDATGDPAVKSLAPLDVVRGMGDQGQEISAIINKREGMPVGDGTFANRWQSGQSDAQKTAAKVAEFSALTGPRVDRATHEDIGKRTARVDKLRDILGREPSEDEIARIFGAGTTTEIFSNPFASSEDVPQEPSFKSPDDVKAAYQSGKISREEAHKILQSDFGYKQ